MYPQGAMLAFVVELLLTFFLSLFPLTAQAGRYPSPSWHPFSVANAPGDNQHRIKLFMKRSGPSQVIVYELNVCLFFEQLIAVDDVACRFGWGSAPVV
jgi:hypothetical protein